LVAGDRERDQLNLPTGSGGNTAGPSSFMESPHDAVGAYLLDALAEDERTEFEAHLATCAECQREVAELSPVVGLLPGVIEHQHVVGENVIPEPSSGLRNRLLQAALADEPVAIEPESGSQPAAPDFEADEPIPFPPPRPQPRSRRTGGGRARTPTPIDSIGRMHRSWLIAAVLAILMVGAGIWSIVLQGDVDDKNQEIARLEQELDTARQRANASAWHLGSGTAGENHSGTLLYGLQDQTVVLVVRNMPALPSDKVYQTWLFRGSTPEPGTTFTVSPDGTGLALVDPKAPTYDAVAITEEPSGGSTAPTTQPLLVGQLSGAVGAIPLLNIAAVPLTPPTSDDAS
jgi:anti-sigma factor RsiW